MPQTRAPIFEDLARLMTDAAGVAQGARREVETIFKTQAERMLSGMDVVRREEFEALRDMAILAREENERLSARIADLEAKLEGKLEGKQES
jgi:BMFP domain-containing protein YqiC